MDTFWGALFPNPTVRRESPQWTVGLVSAFPLQEQILALVFGQKPRSWIQGQTAVLKFQGWPMRLWEAQYLVGLGSMMG